MEQNESKMQIALSLIRESGDSVSFDHLERATGLSFVELSTLIGLLFKENRIKMRVNYLTERTCIYKSSGEALCARFMELLSAHYKRERYVAFYASKLCVSSKYLTTVVTKFSGKSPREWIKNETIREIEWMLRYTQISIKEIAYRFNFPNQSFFGKYFKSQKGVSPKRYREAYVRSGPLLSPA